MTYIYSAADFTRKIKAIKDNLYSDGYYNTTCVARTKVLSGASGRYNRNVSITYTDILVSGISEVGPEFKTFEELVETIDGDVRFTVREVDASKILSASEIWLGVTIVNGVISYNGDNFTTGIMYKVHSNKKSLYNQDRIFILRIGGQQS